MECDITDKQRDDGFPSSPESWDAKLQSGGKFVRSLKRKIARATGRRRGISRVHAWDVMRPRLVWFTPPDRYLPLLQRVVRMM